MTKKAMSIGICAVAFVFAMITGRKECYDSVEAGDKVQAVMVADSMNGQRTNTQNITSDKVDTTDWKLTLVNQDNAIDQDYVEDIELTQLKHGQSVDTRCYPSLQQMVDDCRAAGYSPRVCSSFRTYDKQKKLFDEQTRKYMAEGMSREDAENKTAESVAVPGCSEHELGLAVDIIDENNPNVVSGSESTAVQKWLEANCYKYGFILRYPQDKSDITGIVYEPWHYRYVGREAALEIYSQGICLEEYLQN